MIITNVFLLCLPMKDVFFIGSYTTGPGEAVAVMGNDENMYKDFSKEKTLKHMDE